MWVRLLLFALVLPAKAHGQLFDPGERYFGLLIHGRQLLEFTFVEVSARGGSGVFQTHPISSETESIARFWLDASSEHAWTLSWRDRHAIHETIDELRLIETTQGPALAGNKLVPGPPDGSVREWNLAVIWLHSTLDSHPAVLTNWDALEVVETDAYDFETYTSENGLAGNATRSITQTPDGYIWIGTVDGLSRFDGHEWRTFGPKSTPSLPDEVITWLGTDPNGRLLVGTKTAGLFHFDGNVFIESKCNGLIPGPKVETVIFDEDGSMWFRADYGRYVCRLKQEGGFRTWKFEDIVGYRSGGEHDSVHCETILPLDAHRVVLGSWHGARILDPVTDRITYMNWDGSHVVASDRALMKSVYRGYRIEWDDSYGIQALLPHPALSGIPTQVSSRSGGDWQVDVDGRVFRQNSETIIDFVGVKDELTPWLGPAMEDSEGNLWITSASNGLGRLRQTHIESIQNDPNPGVLMARSLSSGPGGGVLVAAFESIGRIDADHVTMDDLNKPLEGFLPGPFERRRLDGGLILHHCVATSFSDATEQWWGLALKGMENPKMIESFEFTDGESVPLIANVMGGTVHFHTSDEFPTGVADSYSIACDDSGNVWLGTSSGLFILRNGELKHLNPEIESLPMDAVAVLAASSGRVFVAGYEAGLHLFNNGVIEANLRTEDGLPSDTVVSLYEDSLGAIWVGTDSGIARIKAGRVTKFDEGAGFLKGRVSAIVEDDGGYLWFGTPNGIFAARREAFDEFLTGNRDAIGAYHFGTLDGMPNENVSGDYAPSAIKASDGRLYFCVQDGLIRFDPAELLKTIAPPLIRVTRCRSPETVLKTWDANVGGSSLDPRIFPPEMQSVMLLDYAARTFAYPREVTYEHRLMGTGQKEWRQAGGERSAMFVGLDPGDYEFQVRAINHNDAVSEIASFAFTLQPFYHQTWSFRLGVVAVIVAAAFTFYRWRLGYRDRIMALEKEVEMNDERSRIARDMHDEIGSSLGQMRLLGELARDLNTGNVESNRIARQIENLATGCSKSLREIIWSLNPRKGSHEDVLAYVRELVEEFFESSNVATKVALSGTAEEGAFQPGFRRELILILKGILSNTVKHSGAATFHLSMTIEERTLTLETRDDGVGFDISAMPQDAHGLQAIRERVEKLNGELDLVTCTGGGTRFRIRLVFASPEQD